MSAHRFVLRPYQDEAIARALESFQRERARALIVLPTGSGKTVIFAHIIMAMTAEGGRALILAHRDELIEQAVAKLRDVLGPDADIGVVKGDRNEVDAQIIVASVQTVSRPNRLARLGYNFTICVVDEAHHAAAESYRRIFEHLDILNGDPSFNCPQLLGVTATADRGDGVGLGEVFDEIIYDLPLLPMIEQGYLSDLQALRVELKDADYGGLSVRAGDYSDSESGQVFLEANGPAHVAETICTHARDRKTLVFVPTVAAAHETAEAIGAAGISAAAVDGGTPIDERRAALRAFSDGRVRVLTNCGIATEGYDEPSIDCVLIGRPTKSRALYTQMVGRGTRRFPGKENCLIVDLVGATNRHDLMTVPALFGLPIDALKQSEGSIAGAVTIHAAAQAAMQASGELTARTVDLFRRRRVNWIPTATGRFVLSTGQGTIVLRQHGELWDTVFAPTQGQPEILASEIGLGYAQGIAEDFARSLGAGALVAKDASWRSEEPTDKQLYRLRRLGIETAGVRTRGEASDLISATTAQAAF